MPLISARHLVKTYRTVDFEQTVLKDISLDVSDGEFLAIMGRSGAGKSTLLYQLGLLDHPTSGSITIGDTEATSLSREERTRYRLTQLGYVFQDYALLPELTATENVALPILMQGIAKARAYRQSREALEQVGLENHLHKLPSQLSGGEQQRISVARAIAHRPRIIFADEPTASLDSENSEVIMRLFADLHRSGQTVIMVTHEPEYSVYADRIVTISDGTIASDNRVGGK
jgi:putative ABC transport system ATP-binding protein